MADRTWSDEACPSFSPQKAARVAAIFLAAEERIAAEEQAERDRLEEAS